MEKRQATKLAKQLKRAFSEQALNGLGKRVGFCRRERDITPYRLCLGLVEVMGPLCVNLSLDTTCLG